MKKKYAKTHWTIDDVKQQLDDLRDGGFNVPNWTDKECAEWLKNNENDLDEAQVSAGNDFLSSRLFLTGKIKIQEE